MSSWVTARSQGCRQVQPLSSFLSFIKLFRNVLKQCLPKKGEVTESKVNRASGRVNQGEEVGRVREGGKDTGVGGKLCFKLDKQKCNLQKSSVVKAKAGRTKGFLFDLREKNSKRSFFPKIRVKIAR